MSKNRLFLLAFVCLFFNYSKGQLFSGNPNPGDTRIGIHGNIGVFSGVGVMPGIGARGFYRPGAEKMDLSWNVWLFPAHNYKATYKFESPVKIDVTYRRRSMGLFTGTTLNIYAIGDKVSPKNAYVSLGFGYGFWLSSTEQDTVTFLSSPFQNDGMVQDFPLQIGTGTNYPLTPLIHAFAEIQYWVSPLSWLSRTGAQLAKQDAVGIPNSLQIQVGIRLVAGE